MPLYIIKNNRNIQIFDKILAATLILSNAQKHTVYIFTFKLVSKVIIISGGTWKISVISCKLNRSVTIRQTLHKWKLWIFDNINIFPTNFLWWRFYLLWIFKIWQHFPHLLLLRNAAAVVLRCIPKSFKAEFFSRTQPTPFKHSGESGPDLDFNFWDFGSDCQPSRMPTLRLGDIVPDFTADTTEGNIRFHDWLEGSWAIFFR